MSGEPDLPAGRSVPERLVSLGVELTVLALTWRALDGPDPRELAAAAWRWLRRPFEDRAEIVATLEAIRDLPETEEDSRHA